jgi:hypothetical protein
MRETIFNYKSVWNLLQYLILFVFSSHSQLLAI